MVMGRKRRVLVYQVLVVAMLGGGRERGRTMRRGRNEVEDALLLVVRWKT